MKLNTSCLKKIKKYFSQKPNVAAVYLYGSQARGDAEKNSDIDLGILFNKKENKPFYLPQVVFAEELSKILNKKVEIQDLTACSLEFCHRVPEHKLITDETLYSAAEHHLQIAIQCCLDISAYIVSAPVLAEIFNT